MWSMSLKQGSEDNRPKLHASNMDKKRILVVDDERDLCDILRFNLTSAGYLADVSYSAEDALRAIHHPQSPAYNDYDLLLLDVMMPGMSGFELAERLKADKQTMNIPIIFLTAKDAEADMLQGFALGADDYVAKPFSVREVLARVRAVLNRTADYTSQSMTDRLFVYEGLVIDTESKGATIDGRPVSLTRTEYELLRLLLEHPGKVFSRQQLLDRIWPREVIVTERTVDVNIARLRKKLNRYGTCLVSRTGFGYSFVKKLDKGDE